MPEGGLELEGALSNLQVSYTFILRTEITKFVFAHGRGTCGEHGYENSL